MIIDENDEEALYSIHVEHVEDNIQKAPNNQSSKKISNKTK